MQNLKLAADIQIGDKIKLANALEVVGKVKYESIGACELTLEIDKENCLALCVSSDFSFAVQNEPTEMPDNAPPLVSGFVKIEKITADGVKPGDEIRLIGDDVPGFAKVLSIEYEGHRLRILMDLPIGSNIFNLSPDAFVELFTSHREPAAAEPEEKPDNGEIMDRLLAVIVQYTPITKSIMDAVEALTVNHLLDIPRLIELSNEFDTFGIEPVRSCRVCGCTDDDCSQCIQATGEACSWVEEDLCSRCFVPYYFNQLPEDFKEAIHESLQMYKEELIGKEGLLQRIALYSPHIRPTIDANQIFDYLNNVPPIGNPAWKLEGNEWVYHKELDETPCDDCHHPLKNCTYHE